MQWKYRQGVILPDGTFADSADESIPPVSLDQLGLEHWELVGVWFDRNARETKAIFKREASLRPTQTGNYRGHDFLYIPVTGGSFLVLDGMHCGVFDDEDVHIVIDRLIDRGVLKN